PAGTVQSSVSRYEPGAVIVYLALPVVAHLMMAAGELWIQPPLGPAAGPISLSVTKVFPIQVLMLHEAAGRFSSLKSNWPLPNAVLPCMRLPVLPGLISIPSDTLPLAVLFKIWLLLLP